MPLRLTTHSQRLYVPHQDREEGRPTDYLSIVGAIGLTPLRRTLGHAASRCVSFE
jgi:hypothetical protein